MERIYPFDPIVSTRRRSPPAKSSGTGELAKNLPIGRCGVGWFICRTAGGGCGTLVVWASVGDSWDVMMKAKCTVLVAEKKGASGWVGPGRSVKRARRGKERR